MCDKFSFFDKWSGSDLWEDDFGDIPSDKVLQLVVHRQIWQGWLRKIPVFHSLFKVHFGLQSIQALKQMGQWSTTVFQLDKSSAPGRDIKYNFEVYFLFKPNLVVDRAV